MNTVFDFSKVKMSWTKYDVVHLVDLVNSFDIFKMYYDKKAKIDEPILRSFVGVNTLTDPIPEFWNIVFTLKERERKQFACFWILFTGYEYKVLIVILTYNHELYIEEALKGVLMQQTDFPFVALVIDDCSQDRTTSIVRQYECMYPDLIKGIYHDTNYFSKGSASSLFSDDILFTWIGRAKYLASCEGDDYWTKSDKLQKQVDFLESHPDFLMCFHSAMVKWQDGSKQDAVFSNIETREYKPIEIFKRWLVPTASIVVRSDIFRNAKERLLSDSYKWVYTDIVIFLHCAVCGKVYGMNEVMSVYRRTEEGLTRTLERKCADEIGANDDVSNHYLSLIDLFGSQMGLHFKYICLYNYSLYNRKSALIALKQHNVDLFLKYLLASLRKTVVFTLYHYFAVFKWVIWKIALKLFKLDLKKIKKRLVG